MMTTRTMVACMTVALAGLVGCSSEVGEKVGTDQARYASEVTLVRSFTGASHWVSVGAAPSGHHEEALYGIRRAGDIALFSCWVSGHTMASTDAHCEGQRR